MKASLQVFAAIAVMFSSCNNDPESKKGKTGSVAGKELEIEGATEYEFNMIKNPATGAIPIGVFDQEKLQAYSTRNSPLRNAKTTVNAYSFQGPENLGGRTRAIAYDVRYNGTTNRIILAGGVSGGVYKSYDDGATWVRKSPIGDHFSCTSIAQDTRAGRRDTWYYTVGEASGNTAGGSGASYSGNGVYKSTDNGDTWARLTSSNTTALETFSVPQDYISKIIVDPTDGNVYIACAAAIRRSVDSGATWTTVLSGTLGSSNQFTDVVVSSTGKLYAAFGGTNSSGIDGVWESAPGPTSGDVGAWSQIAGAGSGGSPTGWNFESMTLGVAGSYGRVVLAIPPNKESLLYALYFAFSGASCPGAVPEAELFRFNEISGTWTNLSASLPDEAGCLSGNDPFACQTGYDLVIAVKPDDSSTLFLGGTNAYRSKDSGTTWTRIGGYATPASYALYTDSHPDIHCFAFQPGSPLIMLCGNDGGIQRTTVDTATTVVWSQINTGFRTHQYYYVTLDPRTSNAKVLGGAQDNGTSRNIGGTGSSYEIMFGGDGVSVGLSDVILGTTYEYVGAQNGYIYRRASTLGANFGTEITPRFARTVTSAGLFVTLFRLDPDNSEILYYANDDTLYRTTSASTIDSLSWTTMTGVAAAVGTPNDITALATTRGVYSASTASLFFGTSDGRVFRLDNPAAVASTSTPADITGASFPAGAYVSSIAVNPRNDDTVLVTFSSYGVTSVWWSGNANAASPTWTSVEGTLTAPSYRSSAIAITSLGVEYFVGTSVGLYNSLGLPSSVAWTQEASSDLGNAVVSSLALRASDDKLLVGTHGYGMWFTNLTTAALPITLTTFTGSLQNKTALLHWSTASEYNSKQFELERSPDGIAFTRIGTIPATGISSAPRSYAYQDNGPLTNTNFYRLRSVGLDAKSTLSNTIIVRLPAGEQEIFVLENPFRDRITLKLTKPPREKVELRLIDMNGRLVARKEFPPAAQHIQFDVNAGVLSSGVYQLKAMVDGSVYSMKLSRL